MIILVYDNASRYLYNAKHVWHTMYILCIHHIYNYLLRDSNFSIELIFRNNIYGLSSLGLDVFIRHLCNPLVSGESRSPQVKILPFSRSRTTMPRTLCSYSWKDSILPTIMPIIFCSRQLGEVAICFIKHSCT